MKTVIISLTLFGISLFLFSCDTFDQQIKPSGNVTTRNEAFENYQMINASNAFSIYVNFSDSEEIIEIKANDNLHEYIEVTKTNNTLYIGLKDNVSVRGNATLKAYITTKPISAYSGSGATRFILEDPLNAEDVQLILSGASNFEGDLETDNLTMDLSGASIANISGSASIFDVEASGASVFKHYGFEAQSLKANISGASNISLTVNEEIDIEASGASVLNYKGPAVITHQDLSGASSVKNAN